MFKRHIGLVVTLASFTIGAYADASAELSSSTNQGASAESFESAQELPSVAEILEKAVQALGGKDKLQSVKSMLSRGSLSIPAAGITGTVVIQQSSDSKFKMTAEVPGVVESETGSDGKFVWEVSNVTGAEILEGARAEQARFQMALFPLLDMKKYFDTMECTGTETFAGEECYVVVYKTKKSSPMTTYYSVKTGLERGNRLNTVTAMGDLNIVSEVKSYGESNGIKYAKEVEATLPNGMKQLESIEKVEINAKFDANTFAPSQEVADLIQK